MLREYYSFKEETKGFTQEYVAIVRGIEFAPGVGWRCLHGLPHNPLFFLCDGFLNEKRKGKLTAAIQ